MKMTIEEFLLIISGMECSESLTKDCKSSNKISSSQLWYAPEFIFSFSEILIWKLLTDFLSETTHQQDRKVVLDESFADGDAFYERQCHVDWN